MKKIITILLILASINSFPQNGISVKLTKSYLFSGTKTNYQAGVGIMKSFGSKKISFAIGSEFLFKKYSQDKPLQMLPVYTQTAIKIKSAYIIARVGYQFNLSKVGTYAYNTHNGTYTYSNKGPMVDIGIGMNLFCIRKKCLFLEVPIRLIRQTYSDKFISKKIITPDAMISLGFKF